MNYDEKVEALCNYMDATMMSVDGSKNLPKRMYATYMLYNEEYNKANKYVKVYGDVLDWNGTNTRELESAKRILISRLTAYNCNNIHHNTKIINSVYGVRYSGTSCTEWTPSIATCRGDDGLSEQRTRYRHRNGDIPRNRRFSHGDPGTGGEPHT